jgi:hypothetical protein
VDEIVSNKVKTTIIIRNNKDFKASITQVLTPEEYIKKINL